MAHNSVCDWSCKAVVQDGGLFTFVYSYLSQIGMSGSTHLGEAETSLFSDKLYRTSHERTYINGLSVNTHVHACTIHSSLPLASLPYWFILIGCWYSRQLPRKHLFPFSFTALLVSPSLFGGFTYYNSTRHLCVGTGTQL